VTEITDQQLKQTVLERAKTPFYIAALAWELAKTHCDNMGQANTVDMRLRRVVLEMADKHAVKITTDRKIALP
jgi:hypothetical protein